MDKMEEFTKLVTNKSGKPNSRRCSREWFINNGHVGLWDEFEKETSWTGYSTQDRINLCIYSDRCWHQDTFPRCYCGNPIAVLNRKVSEYCSQGCYLSSPERSKKLKEMWNHIDKDKANEKRKRTMVQKYGVAYNSQREEIKPILQRHKVSKTVAQKLDNKDWLINEYKTKNASQIANEIGCYYGTVIEYLKKYGCEIKQNYNTSQIEESISGYIESLGFNVNRNVTNMFGNGDKREVDIVVPDKNLAVEVNGLFWHNEMSGKPANYHRRKCDDLCVKGCRLIQFTDWQWKNRNDICKSILNSALGTSERKFARKMAVESFNHTNQVITDFFNDNHMDGFVSGQKYIVLKNKESGNIECGMILGKYRFGDKYDWEILRYTNKNGHNVIGGFSRCIDNAGIYGTVISYVDKSLFNGKMYSTLKTWSSLPDTDVGYCWTDGDIMISRQKCQKKNLAKWLKSYSPEKSETENMHDAGYKRYYDCGNHVFVTTL